MKNASLAISMAILFGAHLINAQNKIHIQPAPDWVLPVSFDPGAAPAAGEESGFYYLLIDEQENTLKEERYLHFAYKVITSDGIQEMSDISIDYDPKYQNVFLHQLRLHREGKVIDQVTNNIQLLQREQSMDRFLYDGSLTAVINLRDVRAGDIIEFAYTRKGYNPIYEGHISRKYYFSFTLPYEKFYQRIIVPESFNFDPEYRNIDIMPEVRIAGKRKEYIWTRLKTKALILDDHVPDWFEANQSVRFSNLDNWGTVAQWAAKHFSVSSAERKQLSERIAGKFNQEDDETYAREVIRFVQDEIRYLGFESGLNSHKPHPPLKVFDQRFGDCKDKSLLLCELLRLRDIEARPVLVSTFWRDRIGGEPPAITAFNHCVVQFRLNAGVYYVDPTINNQGGSPDNSYFPPYKKGLVVDPATSDLTEFIRARVPSDISEVQTISVPAMEGDAYMHVRTTYTGGEADRIRGEFSNNSLESIQKNYLTFYGNLYPDIEIAQPMKTQDQRDGNIFSVDETYRIPTFWQQSEAAPEQLYSEVYPQTLENYFTVSKSSSRQAPYRLAYPVSYHHSIHIKLPEEWAVETSEELIETDYYQYEHYIRYADREITLQTHYQTRQDHIPIEAFSKFISDHEKMMNNLSFQISYNKGLIGNEKGISWLAVITALVTLGLGLWQMLRLYYYYDPEPPIRPSHEGLPIGGWLILPAIGLIISPFRILYDLFNLPEVYDSQMWANLWGLKRYGLVVLILAEHVFNIVYFLFVVLVGVLFFKRRSSVPRLITIYFAGGAIFNTIDTLITAGMDQGVETGFEHYKAMMQTIVAAVIWIPYFNSADRVKETFVTRINSDDDSDQTLVEANADPYRSFSDGTGEKPVAG